MKRETRLYNILLPIWLLIFLPSWLWLILIPGNLVVDCLVTFLTLCALKHGDKKAVLGRTWWRFWLLGFLADAIGALWMLLGMMWPAVLGLSESPVGAYWEDAMLSAHMLRPWSHPLTFFWTLAGVGIAGVCIYFFDKRAMRRVDALDKRQKHVVALTMAIVTAPWLFFIPLY